VNSFILLLVWLLPLALAPLSGQRYASWITVIAPLPALLAAAIVPVGSSVSLPWLLLGVELGLDDTGRVFLLFSGLLWLVASLYAAGSQAGDPKAMRFRIFFLLAMAGNLGLIVAQDAVSFYLGFTLMGLAVYGLIAHPASQHARRAARRYLVWTIAGEMLLFVAVVMLAAQHSGVVSFSVLQSSPPGGFVMPLLLIGFGIKLALPGLHLWLPQAYAVTPTPAVAVLSGAMIKAGLLGWLRFLPPGDATLVSWGQVLLVTGMTGICFGAILGLLQRTPRLLLGYSSISKMGVLTTGMGTALAWPETAPVIIVAVVIYAAHHALVKAALFLGLGLVERNGLRSWVQAGLVFLALALAGAPLTSGAFAKSVLTASLPQGAQYLLSLLALSAFATTLLMARFLFLVWKQRDSKTSPLPAESRIAWLMLLAIIAVFPFAIAEAGQLMANVIPVFLGILLSALVLLAAGRFPVRVTSRTRRPATAGLVLRFRLAIRDLLCRGTLVIETARSAARNRYARVQRSVEQRLLQLCRSSDADIRWQLAGSLWLFIGGLLFTGLILSL
jgi:formate hydrogenlyase subunit 3/multisubunit Na+/H+ antiporter MnhD subunit